MPAIESNVSEPTWDEVAHLSFGQKLVRLAPVYGLVILMFGLMLLFSILLPDTFPTLLNVRAMLSLAAMIPMVAGRIDLTVGYGIVLWHILAISLQAMYGLPFPVAVLIVLALGAIVGALNGFLVEVARIDSFFATLGTGTALYSIALWHSGGRQIAGVLPNGFYALSGPFIFGLPITACYVVVIPFAMWVILEYTPVGRDLYAIGANPRAAELNGIPTRTFVVVAFITAGLLSSVSLLALPTFADAMADAQADVDKYAGKATAWDGPTTGSKTEAGKIKATIEALGGTVLEYGDTPIAETSTRMPSLTTALLQKYGAKGTHALAINDICFDLMGPALAAAGVAGDGAPKAVAAGDGSEGAYQRIRAGPYQAVTVAKPLNLQGWQVVDELNRAMHGAPASGYMSPLHVVTKANIAFDGGDKNTFDPGNGYRETYARNWVPG